LFFLFLFFFLLSCMSFAAGVKRPETAPCREVRTSDIEKALERGSKYLERLLGEGRKVPEFRYPLGARALYAAALISSAKDLNSSVLRRLYKEMAALPFKRVYSVALYAIAIEYKYKRLLHAARGRVRAIRPTKADRTALKHAVAWLIRAQGPASGGWAYTPVRRGSWYDLSNTQFAVLGLEAGRRFGLAVPADVAKRYVAAGLSLGQQGAGEHELRVTYQFDWSRPAEGVRTDHFRGRPTGWRYSPTSTRPTFAMTAATAGNLFAAEKILTRSKNDLRRRALSGLLYLERNWDRLKRYHRWPGRRLTGNYYYTIWTLEKTFDLGGIALIGGRDWYAEETAFLLSVQNPDGSWGDEAIRPVATAFALLFLSRAQAPDPAVSRAPPVITGKGSSTDRDQVFLSSVRGSVSARAFLEFLKRSPSRKLLRVAQEVVRSYQPAYRGDLAGPLSELLDSERAEVKRFAVKALKEVTGLGRPTAKSVSQWKKVWELLNEAESKHNAAILSACLKEALNNVVLGERLLRIIEAERARDFVRPLIEGFSVAESRIRPHLHRTLCFLTGRSLPYNPTNAQSMWRRVLSASGGAFSR